LHEVNEMSLCIYIHIKLNTEWLHIAFNNSI
jgi:hypothetical protein